jgi:hypothetical protein
VDAGEDREHSCQPWPEDLVKICIALNAEGARYVLNSRLRWVTPSLFTFLELERLMVDERLDFSRGRIKLLLSPVTTGIAQSPLPHHSLRGMDHSTRMPRAVR